MIKSLAVGLAKHQPANKLCYLQQCLDTVAEIGWKNVKHDTLLNDVSEVSVSLEPTGKPICISFVCHFIGPLGIAMPPVGLCCTNVTTGAGGYKFGDLWSSNP